MTDRYAETDTWPNPPASQQPARPATLAASEPSRVVGEGSDAQEAREAAFAEADRVSTDSRYGAEIHRAVSDEMDGQTTVGYAGAVRIARAVAARVDEDRAADVAEYDGILTRQGETLTRTVNILRGDPPELTEWSHHDVPELAAALRAERDRLKRGGAELGRILDRTLRDALDASGRHDVIEEDGDGDWAVVWETLAELRPRAESAERARDAALAEVTGLRDRLGRVDALRDRWLAVDVPSAEVTSWSHYAGAALRAALTVPVTGDTEDASPAAEDTARWTCRRCGSHGWVGWAAGPDMPRKAQCVACGAVQSLAVTGAAGPTEQATEGGAK